jgi:hypothetical protein
MQGNQGQRWMVRMVVLGSLLWGLLGSGVLGEWGCSRAIAAIHTYPEATDQVMVRSLQTIRDRTDQAWQLVLYKRRKAGKITDFRLRLVGFPGTEVNHDGALVISTRSGQTTTAPDVTPDVTQNGPPLTANAAEYDLRSFIPTLNADIALELVVPLQTRNAELVLPPFVVQEWRRLAER